MAFIQESLFGFDQRWNCKQRYTWSSYTSKEPHLSLLYLILILARDVLVSFATKKNPIEKGGFFLLEDPTPERWKLVAAADLKFKMENQNQLQHTRIRFRFESCA